MLFFLIKKCLNKTQSEKKERSNMKKILKITNFTVTCFAMWLMALADAQDLAFVFAGYVGYLGIALYIGEVINAKESKKK